MKWGSDTCGGEPCAQDEYQIMSCSVLGLSGAENGLALCLDALVHVLVTILPVKFLGIIGIIWVNALVSKSSRPSNYCNPTFHHVRKEFPRNPKSVFCGVLEMQKNKAGGSLALRSLDFHVIYQRDTYLYECSCRVLDHGAITLSHCGGTAMNSAIQPFFGGLLRDLIRSGFCGQSCRNPSAVNKKSLTPEIVDGFSTACMCCFMYYSGKCKGGALSNTLL